ncbi:MAG: YbbR-like domain-containing protein [Prolixibacteraceae bacterium]|nr:YbbR-like domain-containing protein [Prolixibacteraceae bacterium]
MKTNWVYKLVKFLKKVYFRNDKRVAAYLICVAIATGFWFLNALSKTYTVTLTAPVTYVNFPDNKTLANIPPDKFDLKIKAHGFTILRHRLSFLFLPIEFNVNEMTNNRMKESRGNSYAFPSRQFLSDLSYIMSNEMEILSMSPDTLYFKFDQMGQKRVKVKPRLKVSLKKQYQISGETKSIPDSVTVIGAQSVIDTIHFAFTEPIRVTGANQTIQTEVKVSQHKEIFFDPKVVEVTIPVEEYTESQQVVPVEMNDQPNDITIKLFPQKVKLSFQVGLSRFSEIKPEDFKLSVSYNDIKEGKQRLKITAKEVPAYLYSIKISPEELEYLIEK